MSDIVFDLQERQFPLGEFPLPGGGRGPVTSAAILNAKLAEVKQALQQLGLQDIEIVHRSELPIQEPAWDKLGDDMEMLELESMVAFPRSAPTTPIVRATWEGQAVYVCFPERAEGFFEIDAVPLAAARYFQWYMPDVVVCHAAFFFQYLSSGTEVDLFGCKPVRAGGKWLEMPGWEDHLPFDKRHSIPRLDAFLGPLALVKNSQLYRETQMRGEIVDFAVEGLYGQEESAASPVKTKMHPDTPCYMLQGCVEPTTGVFKGAPRISMENPQLSEVHVVDVLKSHNCREMLILEDKTGVRIHTDCLECSVLPELFHAGQHFEGNVVMYAYYCSKPLQKPQHIAGSYKRGFFVGERCDIRDFSADPEAAKASATGRVEAVQWLDLGFTKLCFITLQCMKGNDDFHLHVYARPEAMDGYHPKVGDTVECRGFVQFVCTKLL